MFEKETKREKKEETSRRRALRTTTHGETFGRAELTRRKVSESRPCFGGGSDYEGERSCASLLRLSVGEGVALREGEGEGEGAAGVADFGVLAV